MAELAYRNSRDEELKMKTREEWFQKYTNIVLALNQLLKDSQYKDYEKRLKILEEPSEKPWKNSLAAHAGQERGPASTMRSSLSVKGAARRGSTESPETGWYAGQKLV